MTGVTPQNDGRHSTKLRASFHIMTGVTPYNNGHQVTKSKTSFLMKKADPLAEWLNSTTWLRSAVRHLAKFCLWVGLQVFFPGISCFCLTHQLTRLKRSEIILMGHKTKKKKKKKFLKPQFDLSTNSNIMQMLSIKTHVNIIMPPDKVDGVITFYFAGSFSLTSAIF